MTVRDEVVEITKMVGARALGELDGRSGFDHLIESLDDDTREEMEAAVGEAALAGLYRAVGLTPEMLSKIKAGWVCVPVEPTEAMVAAASDADNCVIWDDVPDSDAAEFYVGIYRAMIRAARER